jgi:hypothetical protein
MVAVMVRDLEVEKEKLMEVVMDLLKVAVKVKYLVAVMGSLMEVVKVKY